MAHPPHTPKYGQGGATRCEDDFSICSVLAVSNEGLRRAMRARTRSPGKAPSTKTTLPSRWATPRASRSSDSISSTSSVIIRIPKALSPDFTFSGDKGMHKQIEPAIDRLIRTILPRTAGSIRLYLQLRKKPVQQRALLYLPYVFQYVWRTSGTAHV